MKKKSKTQSVEKTSEVSKSTSTPPVTKVIFPTRYVVVRDGYRVSDKEYETATDPIAINELDFWTRVAKNHSYGEPVKIVVYDPKKHRVW